MLESVTDIVKWCTDPNIRLANMWLVSLISSRPPLSLTILFRPLTCISTILKLFLSNFKTVKLAKRPLDTLEYQAHTSTMIRNNTEAIVWSLRPKIGSSTRSRRRLIHSLLRRNLFCASRSPPLRISKSRALSCKVAWNNTGSSAANCHTAWVY